MNARFEIVRTDAGYHSRLKGGNGETVWTTEVYTRETDAENAIGLLVDVATSFAAGYLTAAPIIQVDERTQD